MKVKAINYTHGGVSIEVIGETPVEAAILKQIWLHGCMTMANGDTTMQGGGANGFYLDMNKERQTKKKGALT